MWHERYLEMARFISGWSKDPSSKVGAVIVRSNNTICSLGFNGFPRNIADNERLLDRDQKLDIIIHAEENALISAAESVAGYTIYVYPYPPCTRCASRIIQSGISKIVFPVKDVPERWVENFNTSLRLFEEAGVDTLGIILHNDN